MKKIVIFPENDIIFAKIITLNQKSRKMKQCSISTKENLLYQKLSSLIEESRSHVAKAVNTAMVYTYYNVGLYIVEYEQEGNERATYGKALLQRLSARLTEKFGKGWSVETLNNCRKFFNVFSKSSTVYTKFENKPDTKLTADKDNDMNDEQKIIHKFTLSWNHYQILMRIKNQYARNFYEIEATKQQWSVRQLQRQVGSSLYERLALSRDKNEVMKLANKGQILEKPADIIKDPMVLEFIGLKPNVLYNETDLEKAIIDKLQDFLLECGKGFLFEARQKRFSFDEDYYFVDLVLYNRLLQCYVLVDLKTGKLSHQDLGQMQMYVNYFDRYIKMDFEKPTIGILLCEQKNNSVVELTLPQNVNIYAQQYALCLPDKELLQKKLIEWAKEYENY